MNREQRRHFGKFLKSELEKMSHKELTELLFGQQQEENFILKTDSYKFTHHLLYPEGIEEVYSYMESRGGEMNYTVFFGLQYYLMKYLAGVRVIQEDIQPAHDLSIKHFGYDCFNRKMWERIVNEFGGRIPVKIMAIPEGTPVTVKNVLMTIRNTDKPDANGVSCAPITNTIETLLMKLWYTNTVAAYSRHFKELIAKYATKTSDAPEFAQDFMVHDFGYRGVSSEETAGLGAAAHLLSFSGTDTFAGIQLARQYYGADMPGYSVIASEHSVMCSYGGKHKEAGAYREIIQRIKKEVPDITILSLVSDTYNIYRVCNTILPELKDEIEGWINSNGQPVKIVVRPDSGDPATVLFGYKRGSVMGSVAAALKGDTTVLRVAEDYDNNFELASELVSKGVFRILFEHFGSTINSKGYTAFSSPHIGVLQGDGISLMSTNGLFDRMVQDKIDTMALVVGSGGKLLQAHDRDEQKYAIKATYVKVNGEGIPVQKDPVTDSGKISKIGYLKLVERNGIYETVQSIQPDFAKLEDLLVPVFENGEILKTYTWEEVKENARLKTFSSKIVIS